MTNLKNSYILLVVNIMNKEFSNIIIFNNNDLNYIKEKILKILKDLDYVISDDKDYNFEVDILHDNINNICVASSKYFAFENADSNKSVIRKIAKRVAQDTFMATSKEDIAVVEKYSFNKRTYDYITFGNEEKLKELGYTDSYAMYMYQEIWKNHFVGRNTIKDLDKVLKEKNTFFNNYEIVIEILKLYGIKPELVTYKIGDRLSTHEIEKTEIYFK